MAMRVHKVPLEKGLHTLARREARGVLLGMPFGPVWDPLCAGAFPLVVASNAIDVGRGKARLRPSAIRAICEGVESRATPAAPRLRARGSNCPTAARRFVDPLCARGGPPRHALWS